jgi:hypothetical protein
MKRILLPAALVALLVPTGIAVAHKSGSYAGAFTDPPSAGNSFAFEATKKQAHSFDFQVLGACSDGSTYRLTAEPDSSIAAHINKKDKFDETFPTNSGQGEVRIKGKFKRKRASGFVVAQRFAPVECTTGEQHWKAKKG